MSLDISAFSELKPYQFDRLKRKYITGVMTELVPVILYKYRHKSFTGDSGIFPLSSTRMRNTMGRITINKEKKYIFDLVQDKKQGILVEMRKGSNITGEVGAYKISDWSHIMDNINELATIKEVKEYKNKSNLPSIDIDMQGLRALKKKLVVELEKAFYDSWQQSLSRRIFFIDLLLEYCKDGKLNQFAERSGTGRLYLKGLNLQGAPKQVRSVALGKHYIYDYKACSYGVFTSLFHILCEDRGIDPYPLTIHLRDYIHNREQKRLKICRDMFWPWDPFVPPKKSSHILQTKEYKQVKTAFTAMGFGAPARAGYYKIDPNNPGYTQTALTSIFKTWTKDKENIGKEVAKKFIEHEFVKGIVKELKTVTKYVLECCLEEDPNLEIIKDRPFKVKEGEKISKTRQLAHIYQGHETQLLELLYGVAGEENTLLLLHDGIATKNKISNADLVALKQELTESYPFVEIGSPEYKGALHTQILEQGRIDAHKQFMAEQEEIAKTYTGISYTVDEKTDEQKQQLAQEKAMQNYLNDLQIK